MSMCHTQMYHGSCCTEVHGFLSSRSILTKEERLEQLEKYREYVKKKLQGIEEQIEKLR